MTEAKCKVSYSWTFFTQIRKTYALQVILHLTIKAIIVQFVITEKLDMKSSLQGSGTARQRNLDSVPLKAIPNNNLGLSKPQHEFIQLLSGDG